MALCFIASQLALAKQRYFLLKVFRSKSFYKIMVLSIVCLVMVLSIVCLVIMSFVFCLHEEEQQSFMMNTDIQYLHMYMHIYVYNAYVHT